MTRIIFYLNVANRARFLNRFLHRKVFMPRQTALIYGSEAALQEVDRALWEEHFLPHQRLQNADAATPIVLTSEAPPPEHACDILISLAPEVPTAFAFRFVAFVDVVGTSDAEKVAARERYRYFKENGYSPEVIDMGKP